MCFFEVGIDDGEWGCCCGCVHIYIGCYCFLVMDWIIMIIFTAIYWSVTRTKATFTNVIPISELAISWIGVICGTIGFIWQRTLPMRIYSNRTCWVAVFCVIWFFILLIFGNGGFWQTIVAMLWLLGAPIYWYGHGVTKKTHDFLSSADADFGRPNTIVKLHKTLDEYLIEGDDKRDDEHFTVYLRPNANKK